MSRLGRAFFDRSSLRVAPELIGCRLVRRWPDGGRAVARIVEVEAYLGDGSDPGSHAHRGQTPRNRSMFGPAGRIYAYRSYGIHTCVNLVCEPRGRASAILLRALQPLEGLERMRSNRGVGPRRDEALLARGPGRLAQALDLELEHDGQSALGGGPFWLLPPEPELERAAVERGPRVGLTQGADLPYRYWLEGSPWVSDWRPGRPRRPRP